VFSRRTPRTHSERLECLLEAARDTKYYRNLLPTKGTISLQDIPFVRLQQFEEQRTLFRSNLSYRVAPALRYPLVPEPVVKVYYSGFAPASWLVGPGESAPFDTIAAPVTTMRVLAAQGQELRYPAVAFSGPRIGLVTAEDREVFWRAFRVPVFDYLLGLEGEVWAEECEAHNGLHIRTENAEIEMCAGELAVTSFASLRYSVVRVLVGLAGRIDYRPCDCGAASPRLVDLRMAADYAPKVSNLRVLAASA
jgi:hypothetical protein